jgi:hypothetical protein
LSAAKTLEELSREHEIPFWRSDAQLLAGWARGRLHDAATGAEDLRRALAERADQGTWDQGAWFDAPFFKGLLAELEAETLGTESALARIDEAMTLARQVETRCNLPFPHLLRGKLLLERDPSNPAPAEEAFQTALEIAKQQGARSWGLRAALSLAKLYQHTARSADAREVLASALEGFSPTPEMPEIAAAQALLAALAQSGEGAMLSKGRATGIDEGRVGRALLPLEPDFQFFCSTHASGTDGVILRSERTIFGVAAVAEKRAGGGRMISLRSVSHEGRAGGAEAKGWSSSPSPPRRASTAAQDGLGGSPQSLLRRDRAGCLGAAIGKPG